MFGNYLLLERIGRGGMAEVFLAHARNALGAARRVVVKQMLPEFSGDPMFARALISEAKLAARLSHNNIVPVLDLGRETGQLYIAMEYVEGFDLNQLLGRLSRSHIPLPLEFAIFIAREVLAALDYAHRAVDPEGTPLGVVHRDVSPANVLISLEGEIRLCDFGIARAYGPSGFASKEADIAMQDVLSTVCAGKAWYMSPEHARGQDVDARSDVFAAGVLLWELCAGKRMYKATDANWRDLSRMETPPELPERGLPDAPRLQALLNKALAYDPAMRFQSAQEMLEELENYALSTHLMASELRFGTFLSEHFGESFVEARRARDVAVREGFSSKSAEISLVATPEPPALPPSPLDPVNLPAGAPLRAAEREPQLEAADRVLAAPLARTRRKLAIRSGSAALMLIALVSYWLATH